jgi:hypothetical protein
MLPIKSIRLPCEDEASHRPTPQRVLFNLVEWSDANASDGVGLLQAQPWGLAHGDLRLHGGFSYPKGHFVEDLASHASPVVQ